LPLHRMRPPSSSMRARGIRSRSASLSKENRGHSLEYEQHAPQAWHTSVLPSCVPSSCMSWRALLGGD
jgi:hypothetical protein